MVLHQVFGRTNKGENMSFHKSHFEQKFDYKKFLETRNKTLLIRIIEKMLEDFKRIDEDNYLQWIRVFEDIEKKRVRK